MPVSRLDHARDHAGLALPEKGGITLFGACRPVDGLPAGRLLAVSSLVPDHHRHAAAGVAAARAPRRAGAAAIVTATRSRAETLGLIASAAGATQPGGPVIVDGARTDGIDSTLKAVKREVALAGSVAKAHGKLFWFAAPPHPPAAFADWRAGLELVPNAEGFFTAPGLFSPGHVDAGSKLLASHFDDRLRGQVADFGAGWGWLSLAALKRGRVERIDLVEADARALDAARLNVTDPRARFEWADVRAFERAGRYDAVITNPPFHAGRAEDHALGRDFIAAAARHLGPRGRLWLVANRHLPYEAAVADAFRHVETLAETPQFKLLLAERPRNTRSRPRR